jgi:putative membrane protein
MMEYGGYGVMLMWLILIILVGIIIYVVIIRGRRSGDWRDQVSENPVEILKRRYAKGEISKEDFERQKKDLES